MDLIGQGNYFNKDIFKAHRNKSVIRNDESIVKRCNRICSRTVYENGTEINLKSIPVLN